jgi:hypothetical protein
VHAGIAITMGRFIYDIEYDPRYVASHTAPLAYTIAGSTGLFAIRDVFLLIFLLAPSLFVLYLFYLLLSVAEGGFLVSFYPCSPRFFTTTASLAH